MLRGVGLRAFTALFESFVGSLIYPILAEQSGLPQVLHRITLPEQPLFLPDIGPVRAEPEPLTTPVDILHGPAVTLGHILHCGMLPHHTQLQPPTTAAAPHSPTCATPHTHASPASASAAASVGSSACCGPYASVLDYHRAYASGATTPTEVAERIIAFIKASEARKPAPCGWFVAWSEQAIRAEAAESSERWRAGAPRSMLDGVPYAVKDVADALPYPTTAGTTFMAAQRPVLRDAPYVAALRGLGAVLLGKTSLHEIGLGITGLNCRTGTALNPHDPGHFTGGSSSGTAAVLAAGLCPIALGSDGGGSIRIPSSFCGVVGFKPSAGRVSGKGCVEIDCTVATMGAMACCVQDAALLHMVLVHFGCKAEEGGAELLPPPRLPRAWPRPGPGGRPLDGVRVGVYEKWFSHASAEVLGPCRAALASLERLGCRVVPVVVPELEHLRVAHTVTIVSEMFHNFQARYKAGLQSSFNGDVRLALANSRFWTPADYLQAQRVRARANVHFRRALAQVDVLVTPTTPIPAPPIHPSALKAGESNLEQVSVVMRFMVAANMLGLPAVSLPVGPAAPATPATQHQHQAVPGAGAAGGLPVALQLIGAPLGEATLMRVAAALEAELLSGRQEAAAAAAAAAAAVGAAGQGQGQAKQAAAAAAAAPPAPPVGVCNLPKLFMNPLTGFRQGL